MKIDFCSLSSSSSGNCHYIGSEKTKILIDAGFSGKKIEALLEGIDVKCGDINGIFVTHEHTDHIKGVGVLSRRYNIPIFANEGTWAGMEDALGKIKAENIRVINTDEYFNFNDLDILPVKTYHDANESVGYIINQGRKKLSIITDTGKLDQNIVHSMKDSDIYLVESNHDIQMLRNGPYPVYLQNRIRGDFGHLSNDYIAKIMQELVRGRGETILLAHISKDNNSPKTAFNEMAFKLMENGIDIKSDINLELTYRDRQTRLYTI